MKVAVIVLNYKTGALAVRCLSSLIEDLDQSDCDYHIYMVDNCSPDDSATLLKNSITQNNWSPKVTFIEATKNGGYAYGNNLGIRAAIEHYDPDYLWLVNPDTRVLPNAAGALLNFLAEHPQVGLCGSRLQDEDSTLQISAFRFPSLISEIIDYSQLGLLSRAFKNHNILMPPSESNIQTDWVAGASLMIRRAVFDSIGLMDENYFLYYEEVDYILTARRTGYRCWYVPSSRVIHMVGAATGISDHRKQAPRRPKYWFESRRRYFLKNRGPLYTLLTDLAVILAYSTWVVRCFIQRKDRNDPPYFLRDFIANSVLCKGFRL